MPSSLDQCSLDFTPFLSRGLLLLLTGYSTCNNDSTESMAKQSTSLSCVTFPMALNHEPYGTTLQHLGQLIQWLSNGTVSGRRIYCMCVHRPPPGPGRMAGNARTAFNWPHAATVWLQWRKAGIVCEHAQTTHLIKPTKHATLRHPRRCTPPPPTTQDS